MARLPDIKREDLDAQGQAAYDQIAGSRGRFRGLSALRLPHPSRAERVAAGGEQFRSRWGRRGPAGELPFRPAGREGEPLSGWAAHEPLGLQEGPRPEAI